MKPLRFAVAGLGRIGRLHARLIKCCVEGAELALVVDAVEELARRVGAELRVDWETSYEKALEKGGVDAVVIATPTFLHKDMILEALERGVHVFVEKPMTRTVSEALEVVKAVSRAGRVLQVGYMRRFDPAFSKAKKSIEDGVVGEPISYVTIVRDPQPPPGWAADPSKSGGMFLDMLSHDFDMARWLLSDEVAEVYVVAAARVSKGAAEYGDVDVANIVFKTSKGRMGAIHAARKSPYGYDLRVEVYGTKGVVAVGDKVDNTFHLGLEDGVVYGGIAWFEKRFHDAYIAELEHFVASVREEKKPLVNEVDGYRVVEIAESLWRSYRENKPVTIEYRV
ncbi:MAG: Gfo/Idh/MocA family oxidoreductase [Desulfurococcales archaeon]|nr:Gfo/Idh/MocA family oxidoreductase [Desulfurococcales archaeon]